LLRKLRKLDIFALIITTCLVAIGTIAVYEATSGTQLDGLHISNVMLFGAFCVPMLLIALTDYKLLTGKLAYVLYGVGICLLILVTLKGENINGAARWLSIGSFQLQPSELVKLSTILLAARYLSKRNGEKLRLLQDIVPFSLIFLIPTVLIMKQPDLGTALVFVGIFLSMLWMGNIRIRYLMLGLGAVTFLVMVILWLYNTDHKLLSVIAKPHQISRLQTFLDPASDPDKSWHVNNAMYAISAGGQSGGPGFYIHNGYIPYAYSDSIFVVIGEKYGFIGSAILLLLYFMLMYRFVNIVWDSKELAGSYLVIGIISMFVFQIFVNIGMHIGLVPLTGISLPFISYGGSSLLTYMIAIGLVLSVHIHKNIYIDHLR